MMEQAHESAGFALVTGASSGIGRELARVLAAHGHDLILTARRESLLEQLAGELRQKHAVRVDIIAADLAQPGAAQGIAQELARRSLSVEILVNNAGVGLRAPFAESDPDRQLELLQVNVVALTQLSRLLLPGMIKRGAGRILNVASIAGYLPGPLTATYNASKAYVLSFSEALAWELRSTGVTVTVLCPGPTRTEFATRAGLEQTRAFRGKVMDAASVARAGYCAMMKGRLVVVPGLRDKLRAAATRLAPRRILARFSHAYHRTD